MGIAALILVIVLHAGFFHPVNWLNISDKDKFSGKSWEKQLTISIFDYLPIYAKFPPIIKAPEKPEVLSGEATFEYYKKGSDYQESRVVVTKPATFRLPLFDYPGMRVVANGKKIDHWHNDCRHQEFCLGLITFQLPAGEYYFKAQLTNTPVRTVGNSLTLLSSFILILLFINPKKLRNFIKR